MKIHIKRGDESSFLFETTVEIKVEDLIAELVKILNGILKVQRLCQDEQRVELKLKDEFKDVCIPSGGYIDNEDPVGRRNGRAPNKKMKDILARTISEANTSVSKNQVAAGVCMTRSIISDSLDKLRGATAIVYPMNLPPYDIVRQEFEGIEDLSGTQAGLQVLEESHTQLWWAGKELTRGKKLADFVGKNEKTKIIAKLQKKGQGPPAREAVITKEEKKAMMAYAYRKQEEHKKLEADSEDAYLNAEWADPHSLKKKFSGIDSISWKPK